MYRILVIGMLQGVNGVATSVMNLYRNLDRSRFQYDFLLPNVYRDRECHQEEIKKMGGHVYYMNVNKNTVPPGSRPAFRELLRSIPDLQGVHVHDIRHNTYPLYCAHQLGLPIKVIQYHTALGRTEMLKMPAYSPCPGKLRQIAGDDCDRLACCDFAGQYAYGKMPYEVIPNGVDTRRFSYNPLHRMLIRRRLGIGENAPVLGFIGNLYYVKNPMFALRVFREFKRLRPDAHMIMLGSGPQVCDAKEYAAKRHIKKSTHIMGWQTEVDMFLSAMDLVLCPSLKEGLPNVMVEAQAAGASCLVSDEVTPMVRLTPLVTLAPLQEGARAWAGKARHILDNAEKRRSWSGEIRAAGYDIRDVAADMMERYRRRIEGK